MEFRGTFTASDLVAAQWLHVRPRPAYALVGIAILGTAIFATWHSFSKPNPGSNAWLLLGSVVLIGASALWTWHRTTRTFRQRKDLQRAIRFETTDSGLITENETGRGTTPWSDFLRWKENERLFLLYLSDDMFHIVPKSFFGAKDDVPEFRELLIAKVGRR